MTKLQRFKLTNNVETPKSLGTPIKLLKTLLQPCVNYFSAWYCPPRPLLQNTSLINDIGTTATFQCFEGHRFPDGSNEQDIHCVNNEWLPVIEDLDACEGMTTADRFVLIM